MFMKDLLRPSGSLILSLFLLSSLLPQIVLADVDVEAFRFVAKRLQPNECQRVINREASDSSFGSRSSSNGIDCFRKLLNWSSSLRINRRDARLLLGNRLHQIGRNDLAQWLGSPSVRRSRADLQTIEYDSWDSKNESNPRISELIYGPARSPAGNFQQQPNIPDLRRFNNGNHGLDFFKDRSIPIAAPQTRRLVTLSPEGSSAELPGRRQEEPANITGTNPPQEANVTKDERPADSGGGDKEEKRDKQNSSKILPHFADDKVPPCLRVPLSTALVVIGTIMTLTCCCALLLRNRLAACFERFRGKKSKTRRLSADEEQGFMGPRTFGKVPKRSGRKGGGPIDVAHVGIQNNNNGSNGSVRESDEPPTGCCNCCAKKKKKNKRKRSKK